MVHSVRPVGDLAVPLASTSRSLTSELSAILRATTDSEILVHIRWRRIADPSWRPRRPVSPKAFNKSCGQCPVEVLEHCGLKT